MNLNGGMLRVMISETMKPVRQTRLAGTDGETPGNCFQACLASIFDVPLEDVPDWKDRIDAYRGDKRTPKCRDRTWQQHWMDVQHWLRDAFQLTMLEVKAGSIQGFDMHEECLSIATGRSRRGTLHACVARGKEIVHDPHPKNEGLNRISTFTYFVNLHPDGDK